MDVVNGHAAHVYVLFLSLVNHVEAVISICITSIIGFSEKNA